MRQGSVRAPQQRERHAGFKLQGTPQRARALSLSQLSVLLLVLALTSILFAFTQEARWRTLTGEGGPRAFGEGVAEQWRRGRGERRGAQGARGIGRRGAPRGSSGSVTGLRWTPDLLPPPARLTSAPAELAQRRLILGEFSLRPYLAERWRELSIEEERRLFSTGDELLSYESGCFGPCDGAGQIKENLATALLRQLELFQRHGQPMPTLLSYQVIEQSDERDWLTTAASLWLPAVEGSKEGRLLAWWLHWSPAWFNALRCQRSKPYRLPAEESRFQEEWSRWLQESELACDPPSISTE